MRTYTDPDRTGDLVSEGEVVKLMEGLCRGQGNFTEDEAVRLVKWAHEQRTGALMVDMVIQGAVSVTVRDGAEPIFSADRRERVP